MLYILKKMLQQTHIWVHYFPFSCEYLRFAKMENTHMHRLKILQYCKVKGEREVNPIYLSMKVKVKQLVAHSCPTLCDPMYCSTPPGSSVRGFFRQEYWSGLPCPSPGDLPDPGIEPGSPALQVDSLPAELLGKPHSKACCCCCCCCC